MQVIVKLLTETAKIPTKGYDSDAGFDIYADEDVLILPGQTVKISTGISCTQLSKRHLTAGLVWDRSSLASKGQHTLAGVLDYTYVGEIKVVMTNLNVYPVLEQILKHGSSYCPPQLLEAYGYQIKRGDKIAQIVFQQVLNPTLINSTDYDGEFIGSERGSNGFGSTGK